MISGSGSPYFITFDSPLLFSHWEFEAEPEVETSKQISLRECSDMHATRVFEYNGMRRSVALGKSSFAVTTNGALRYDESKGTVACVGDRAALHPDSPATVEQSLVFEAANLVLTVESGRRLTGGSQTVVLTSGEAQGLEISHLEDRQGGLMLATMTIATPPLDPANPPCPLALLRQQLELIRVSDGYYGSAPMMQNFNASRPTSTPKAILWANSKLVLHQEEEAEVPSACRSSGTVYYKTNHLNVIISSSSSPTIRRLAKQNPLDYLSLSDLAQASRSDFIHNHVNEILHNITTKIQNLECFANIQDLASNSFKDKNENTRIRYLPSGELVFKLECPKVVLSPGYADEDKKEVCTRELPAHISKNKYMQGVTVYIEPKTRFVMTSAKQVPCALQQLAPPAYLTMNGNYIYHNGTEVKFLEKKVIRENLLKRKYDQLQEFDISQDLDNTGIETDEELHNSALFVEYARFVQVQERSDLAGRPPLPEGTASAAGKSAHSWWMKARANSADFQARASELAGLSSLTWILRALEETWAAIHPFAVLGGFCFALQIFYGLALSAIRMVVLCYSRPGTPLKDICNLSFSASSRTQDQLHGHFEKLLTQKVAHTVDQEMTVLTAKMLAERPE